ncbi:uncharacterized protein LOC117116305 [Anneissia japonica]|uniref:uncharacterized protein LOC117116305 n=1 Tax=Anneissia japonica TaxID=1529436 RepID=UPI00142585D5|nr:uncharacterized protein LOC117116305 [Anneissia japonica]
MAEETTKGISDEDYRQLLHDISEWYDGIGSISMLKVLYSDLTDVSTLDKANKMRELLNNLHASGSLSPTDLSILYDTINITKQFGFKPKNEDLLPLFQNVKNLTVSKFTSYRQKLVKLGMTLNEEDVATLNGSFNTLLKKYEDRWHLIRDLEHRRVICEENMKAFIERLERLQLFSAVEALLEDEELKPTASKRQKLMLKGDQDGELKPTASKRRKLMLEGDQDTVIKNYLLKRQKNLCCRVNRFTPATLRTLYQVDIANMFTDLELLKKNKKEGEPVTLQELLDVIKSTPACRTLIEGEGGIGKSTLLRYLAYNWANDSDKTFEGKIVFLINVRDIGKGEDIFNVILKQSNLNDFEMKTYLPNDPMLIKRFILRHDDEIVLLLDGLDELEDGNVCPISLFKKQELEDSNVILTSRSENINEFIKVSSVHVKVKGFDAKNIRKYIKKHFDYFEGPELGDSLIKELNLYTEFYRFKHLEVILMCKNPMLLLSVCTMWEDKHSLPTNKADLFKEVFRSILNQFNKQEGNTQKITKFSDTPIEYVHAMLMLGKCMYKSLKRNQLSINSRDLEGKKEMVFLALKLGFVYLDEPHSKTDFEQCFTAPHKLIVESLVGFYISKLCQTAGLENECAGDLKHLLTPLDEDEWEIIRESEYLEMARTFTIQFLGANVGKFFIHWLTKDLSTYRSLMKNYLRSLKAEHQVSVEEALIDHMTKTHLKIQPHVNGICKSLMRYIHHINPSLEVFEDEHFIKLTRIIYGMTLRLSVTPPRFKSLCNKMSSEEKGKMLAHILFPIRDHNYMLENIIPEVCADDDIKYLTAEYKKLDMHYDIRHYQVFNKSSITTIFLIHLLTNSPKLKKLHLNFCITGDIMNDMIRELSGREIKLALETLYIYGNNLSTINGASLASLMSVTPQLNDLNLSNCSLTGDIMNDMIRELSSRGIKLELKSLDIDGNNLSTINGASLAFLITQILHSLHLSNCSLTGDIMNDMIRELSSRGIKLGLRSLDIDGNNLSTINVASLASLITPILHMLQLSNCNLTGDIMNDMIRELSSRGIKLELVSLYINDNNLSTINGASLAFLITQILHSLHLSNCSLTGDIMNDMIRELSSRGIKLGLKSLDIDGNNLSTINGASLASLITPILCRLHLSNCNLTGDIMNDMIRELSGRGIKLVLWYLDIDGNNLSTINVASLASLMSVTPQLIELHLSNCSLTGDIMNDMIRELSSRGIKLGLKSLYIDGNNLSTINGASLASLITPILDRLHLSNCNLTGDIMNDMIRELSSRGIKLGLESLHIDGNNLSTINVASLASLMSISPLLIELKLSNCSLTGDIMNDMIRELSSRGIKLGLVSLY